MGKLQDFQLKMTFNEDMFMPTDTPPFVYHYTSASGFESILFSNPGNIELWASRHDCLNDCSEGLIVQERYKRVCERMLAAEELSSDVYDIIIDMKEPHTALMTYQKGDKCVVTRPEYSRYICSFSKNPDSLAMWNYYSKGSMYEGFNLGFSSQALFNSAGKFFEAFESRVYMHPVIYNTEEQETLIRNFLLELMEHYQPGDETSLRYMTSNQLMNWALVFKSEFFKHEEEVRLIIYVSKDREKRLQKGIPQLDVRYRISNGYTIPYIKMVLEKECLSDATIGHLLYNEAGKLQQLEVFAERLSVNGYTVIEHCSQIPVRY